ncbi:MAG: hypothetical protein PHD56_05285 [Anaerostipes sp.]|nr:hypothetical protein [Anaerostipes sp.]
MSGHSSGGILAAYIAGKLPEMVSGLLLEDPPFFNVEPEEMQNTFVYKDGFQLYHHYLNQTKESSDRMMKLMTNAERVVVRSGNDIHYEKPEKFIKALDLLENNRQCSDFI